MVLKEILVWNFVCGNKHFWKKIKDNYATLRSKKVLRVVNSSWVVSRNYFYLYEEHKVFMHLKEISPPPHFKNKIIERDCFFPNE